MKSIEVATLYHISNLSTLQLKKNKKTNNATHGAKQPHWGAMRVAVSQPQRLPGLLIDLEAVWPVDC